MAGPDDAPFNVGQRVLLDGDVIGTLVRALGKGKWVVKVDGEDKSKVVPSETMRKYVMKAPVAHSDAVSPRQSAVAPKQYSIVGTWDDWEPHDMTWSAETMCFGFVLTIGSDGCEAVKFLQDANWDLCVHPGRPSAGPGDAPSAPEDGGLEAEWSVGGGPGEEGACYQVRLFLHPDGLPKQVDWRRLTAETAPVHEAAGSRAAKLAEAEPEIRRERVEPVAARTVEARRASSPEADRRRVMLDYEPITRRVGGEGRRQGDEQAEAEDRKALQQLAAEETVVHEREARERLSKRFEAEESLAVPDGGLARQQAEELQFKLARNRRRYQRSDDAASLIDPGYAQRPAYGAAAAAGRKGKCVECGRPTEEVWDFGGHCCQSCIEDFNSLTKEGWTGDVVIDGISAHDRARKLQQEFDWTAQEARIAVMRTFHHMFRPGAASPAPAPKKPMGLQRCTRCSCVGYDGQSGADGGWYCPSCFAFRPLAAKGPLRAN
mmetsp:Transcript_44104/g.127556  ORF Transcript_44104/g.127556 Transcript_44104/m.127556 type:complete len:490 (-) Transcript_44104:60-1529(-)